MVTSAVQAAIFEKVDLTAVTDVLNDGVFIYAYNVGDATDTTVNGVTFVANDGSGMTGSVAVGVIFLVDVMVGDTSVGEGSGAVGVKMLTLSSVGNESIDDDRPPSVNVSSKLPSTIAIDRPAARTPRMTLLRPKIPFFTQAIPFL